LTHGLLTQGKVHFKTVMTVSCHSSCPTIVQNLLH